MDNLISKNRRRRASWALVWLSLAWLWIGLAWLWFGLAWLGLFALTWLGLTSQEHAAALAKVAGLEAQVRTLEATSGGQARYPREGRTKSARGCGELLSAAGGC